MSGCQSGGTCKHIISVHPYGLSNMPIIIIVIIRIVIPSSRNVYNSFSREFFVLTFEVFLLEWVHWIVMTINNDHKKFAYHFRTRVVAVTTGPLSVSM